MKDSLSPDIIVCGWLGLKHQLTNFVPKSSASNLYSHWSSAGPDHDLSDSSVTLAGQPGFWSVAGLHSPPATASPASTGSGGESSISDDDHGLPNVEESWSQQPESHQHEGMPHLLAEGLSLMLSILSYFHLISCRQNVKAKAKCLLCYESHVKITLSYGNFHDMTARFSLRAASRVAGNTALAYMTECTNGGKWLHTLPSHSTLGEPQGFA